MLILPYDRDALKAEFDSAQPFRHIVMDPFLDPAFAREAAAAFPSFGKVAAMGSGFDFVNERNKIQISDESKFPEPIRKLNQALASPDFLADLGTITGIPKLLADETLAGGGMHVTGPHGRLDVHVDFNYVEDRQVHRRLNLLLYLNPRWEDSWDGAVEFWDRHVKECQRVVYPVLNRCVLFETSEISYHGVQPLRCPDGYARQSFAAYYYTAEAPPGWKGTTHSTIFKARPSEKLRGYIQMPVERLQRRAARTIRRFRGRLTGR